LWTLCIPPFLTAQWPLRPPVLDDATLGFQAVLSCSNAPAPSRDPRVHLKVQARVLARVHAVLKSAASGELLKAARMVLAGGQYVSPSVGSPSENLDAAPANTLQPLDDLSEREREVLKLVASGATAREAASQLGISERTIQFHKERIKQRLGAKSTMEAVKLFLTHYTHVPSEG
jgi:DNA-binding CsgD family transcriptional regulator